MKKIFLSLVLTASVNSFLLSQNVGNVGIGTTSPNYKLDVVGSVHGSSNASFDGYLGIGTTSPSYKLQVNDGSIAIFNSTDTKTWLFNYSSIGNYFQLSEGGTPRMVVANGGNVGIGTIAPTSKLHVNGTANIETDLAVGGTVAVDGNLTVNNGKGIVRSWNGSQIKYYTQESSVHAVLPAFGTSIEGTIAWPPGIFTLPPQILVGNVTASNGSITQIVRIQIVTYDATTHNCKFRLINTGNSAVDVEITWNIVYVGQ